MTPLETAQYMLNQDYFSQWMGISLVEVREHYCLIEMPIKKENESKTNYCNHKRYCIFRNYCSDEFFYE